MKRSFCVSLLAVAVSGNQLVNFEKYPIDQLFSSENGSALVEYCRQQFQELGFVQLDNFVPMDTVEKMLEEIPEDKLYHRQTMSRAYGIASDDDDPLKSNKSTVPKVVKEVFPLDIWMLAGDLTGGYIRALYEMPAFRDFIAAVVNNKMSIYSVADRLQDATVLIYKDGGLRGWHYDRYDFSITLLLQASTEGGEFEFAPNIRGPNEENYNDVERLFNGDFQTHVMDSKPGSLTIFAGRDSLHRVRAAYGKDRVLVYYGYDTKPTIEQHQCSVEKSMELYGERIRSLAPEQLSRNA